MELTITDNGDKLVGTLNGRLDTVCAEQFGHDMQPLMNAAERDIMLDCKDLEYISSSGLRLFLTLRKQVAAQGGKLTLTNLNEDVQEVFTLTGFSNLFDIV